MKKFVVLSLVASAALGLAACTPKAGNTTDGANTTDDTNLSTGMDGGNMTDNVVDANSSGNSAM